MIGPGELDGLIWATGHWRNGVLLAPLTGDAVAALLAGDEPPERMRALDPSRFGGARHDDRDAERRARASCASAATVEAVVLAAGAPDGRGVAVAVDGEVVPRGEWATTELRDGQQVEVLHAVQGGA